MDRRIKTARHLTLVPRKRRNRGIVVPIITKQPVAETLRCVCCGHDKCKYCEPKVWNMIGVQGLRCCECGRQHSLEVWRSEGRRPVKFILDRRTSDVLESQLPEHDDS